MATTQMTTVQIRIDEKTKNSTKKILNKLGLDMSGAIRMYLRQVARTKSLSLDYHTLSGSTVGREILQTIKRN